MLIGQRFPGGLALGIGHGQVGPPDFSSGQTQRLKSLRRRDFVNQVTIDIQQIRLPRASFHHVDFPHFIQQISTQSKI